MSDRQLVEDVVELVKRLQTFDFDEIVSNVAKIPPGIIKILVRDWRKKGVDYRTFKISMGDEEALNKLDLTPFQKELTPRGLEAIQLLKDKMSFDPDVIAEARNYLPHGMTHMEVGAASCENPEGSLNNHL